MLDGAGGVGIVDEVGVDGVVLSAVKLTIGVLAELGCRGGLSHGGRSRTIFGVSGHSRGNDSLYGPAGTCTLAFH